MRVAIATVRDWRCWGDESRMSFTSDKKSMSMNFSNWLLSCQPGRRSHLERTFTWGSWRRTMADIAVKAADRNLVESWQKVASSRYNAHML